MVKKKFQKRENFEQSMDIDISKFTSGMYYVVVKNKNEILTEKLLIL